MKKPISLEANHLSSIITAMLNEMGVTEFTFTFDQFIALDLVNKGLECTAEWSDKEYPDSITVKSVSLDEVLNG